MPPVALVLVLLAGRGWNPASEPLVLRLAATQLPRGVPGGAVSTDGRYVAFASLAPLLPLDTNSVDDIYVLDRQSGRLTLETLAADGRASDGSALHPQLSLEGRFLAFDALASTLTGASDRNGRIDVFLRDRRLGGTARVSVGIDGEDGNGDSKAPALSDDGAVVAFESNATNLVEGGDENGHAVDVYVVQRASGRVARAGVDREGRQFGQSYGARLSADGRFVVFAATPGAAGPAGAGRAVAVYLRDLAAGTTACLSCGRDGRPGRAAFAPDISADGSLVAYAVQTAPRRSDIVVHDRAHGVDVVVTDGANAASIAPRLSGDGRIVAFESLASNLLCRRRCAPETLDENLLPDIYLYDRAARTFRRASGARRTWWAPAVGPDLDGRGEVVVFSSREAFGPEDVTADFDLFVCAPTCP